MRGMQGNFRGVRGRVGNYTSLITTKYIGIIIFIHNLIIMYSYIIFNILTGFPPQSGDDPGYCYSGK